MGGGNSKPVLYTIPISHFCEAARWALVEAKVDFEEQVYLPGLHMMMGPMARIRGEKDHNTPLLADNGTVLANDSWQCLSRWGAVDEDLRKSLNEVVGPHVRAIVYSHLLPNKGVGLKPLAEDPNHPWAQRFLFGLDGFRGTVAGAMRKAMVKNDDYIAHCREELEDAVRKLEVHVAKPDFTERPDGRPTANAIAVAALFAPMVSPPNYAAAVYGSGGFPLSLEKCPPSYQEEAKRWRETPLGKWTMNVYAKYYNHAKL
mmetsp:Transcript_32188/g.75574  ORF Transcript_32188/g.75574 Transcript_32188/m.75574 type:complete len:259 (-) Transcript_32188:235-1011(-)